MRRLEHLPGLVAYSPSGQADVYAVGGVVAIEGTVIGQEGETLIEA
jgi:hypothetical protein